MLPSARAQQRARQLILIQAMAHIDHGPSTMAFNPLVRLDPSQVVDRRNDMSWTLNGPGQVFPLNPLFGPSRLG